MKYIIIIHCLYSRNLTLQYIRGWIYATTSKEIYILNRMTPITGDLLTEGACVAGRVHPATGHHRDNQDDTRKRYRSLGHVCMWIKLRSMSRQQCVRRAAAAFPSPHYSFTDSLITAWLLRTGGGRSCMREEERPTVMRVKNAVHAAGE